MIDLILSAAEIERYYICLYYPQMFYHELMTVLISIAISYGRLIGSNNHTQCSVLRLGEFYSPINKCVSLRLEAQQHLAVQSRVTVADHS